VGPAVQQNPDSGQSRVWHGGDEPDIRGRLVGDSKREGAGGIRLAQSGRAARIEEEGGGVVMGR
jgi:hypothetical protein